MKHYIFCAIVSLVFWACNSIEPNQPIDPQNWSPVGKTYVNFDGHFLDLPYTKLTFTSDTTFDYDYKLYSQNGEHEYRDYSYNNEYKCNYPSMALFPNNYYIKRFGLNTDTIYLPCLEDTIGVFKDTNEFVLSGGLTFYEINYASIWLRD